jgi:hypothetical protein
MNCAKSMNICLRLGITGFPTLSILEGAAIYDYQGPLSLESLNTFAVDRLYKKNSRARRISHEKGWHENLTTAVSEHIRVTWGILMVIFEAFGMGHYSEESKLNIVLYTAFTPILLFIGAIIIDYRALVKMEAEKKKNKKVA